ncbi:MAG: DUF1501 domain-containing protein [Pirellulales bacterium]
MFRISAAAARSAHYCDGMSRRSFVQLGMAGLAGFGLADLARAAEATQATDAAAGNPAGKRETSVILIWLDGGPSHIDTYDMKPDAPSEYRGLWSPQKTNIPGIEVSEFLPEHAKHADKYALLRSLHHDNGDHFTAAHWILTAHGGPNGNDTAGRTPFLGAVASKLAGARSPGMPAHVALPSAMSVGLQPGYFGGSYLGPEYNPFNAGDPNTTKFQVKNLTLESGLTLDRLNSRAELREHFDTMRREVDQNGAIAGMDKFQQKAYDLVTSPQARTAFDIGSEDAKARDNYGRTTFGQSTLLARRLVESGVTFVTVFSGGWDHHWDLKSGYEKRWPEIDKAVGALLSDLHDRGLLDTTLVMLCGEFGRTPKMNDGGNGGPAGSKGTPGRDHWGNAMSVLMAGGGVKGGRIVGATDARGERPTETPVTPSDLHRTVYHVLGIDPEVSFLNHSGRPMSVLDGGDVIRELF